MENEGLRYDQRAIRYLSEEDYSKAGELYTTSARSTLSGGERTGRTVYDEEEQKRTRTGSAVTNYASAAVCHRIADASGRARCVASEGSGVARELGKYVLKDPVEKAACRELIGDLYAVVGDDRSSDAYDAAKDMYSDVDIENPAKETGRPLLQTGTEFLTHISRPDDLAWDDIHSGDDPLSRRVEVKRSKTGRLADRCVSERKLHAPRGSTEYATGRYECPNCGSEDVNYIAETTLCLRCSKPTERV